VVPGNRGSPFILYSQGWGEKRIPVARPDTLHLYITVKIRK